MHNNFEPLSDADAKEAARVFLEAGRNYSEAARRLKISHPALRNRVKRARERGFLTDIPAEQAANSSKKDQFKADFSKDSGQISSLSGRIKTLDDALEAGEVDLDVWEVERYVQNKWEVGAKMDDGTIAVEPLWQVKIWLKRKMPKPLETALERVTERLMSGPLPRCPEIRRRPSGEPHLLVISLYDHHFGKLAWKPETGESYDYKIAERLYLDAIKDLLGKTDGFFVDRISLPVGNDFFHINSLVPTTEKGTLQDVDTRLPKIFEVGILAVIKAVDICLHVAPVQIDWVPGNHDPLTSYFLCMYLKAYYRSCPTVTVNVSPKARKYVHYGINLLGMTHGDSEPHRDLPAIMAGECRDIWSEVRHCEWHVGHLHKKKQTMYSAGDTFGGVTVRILPSLCAVDAWHYKHGYVNSPRAAEAYLFGRDSGYVGHLSTNARILEAV